MVVENGADEDDDVVVVVERKRCKVFDVVTANDALCSWNDFLIVMVMVGVFKIFIIVIFLF